MSQPARVLDLFSGPGGMGTGFSQYFQVDTAVDWDPDCVRTYSYNHRDTEVLEMDVRDLSYTKKDYDNVVITPSPALVTGGPPCQDFSKLNRKKDWHSERAYALFEMSRAIRELDVDGFMIENVAQVPREYKQKVAKELQKLGYKVVSRVVHASDYGSIQKRPRWIVTGHRKRHIFPEKVPNNRQAKEILIPGKVSEMGATERTVQHFEDLEAGKWNSLPGQSYASYFPVDPDGLLPSITP